MAQKRIDIVYRTLDEIQPDPKNPRRNDSAVPPVMMAQIARQIYLQWLRCSG